MKSIKILSFTKKASKSEDFVLIFSRMDEILRNYFRMSYYIEELSGRNPSEQTRLWEKAGTSLSPFDHEFYSLIQ